MPFKIKKIKNFERRDMSSHWSFYFSVVKKKQQQQQTRARERKKYTALLLLVFNSRERK